MLDAATETETETESVVEDEFTPLFAITQRRRARLFRDGNLNLLARLKITNRPRYEKLLARLAANGVKDIRGVTAAVDKQVRAVERAVQKRGTPGAEQSSPLAMARRFHAEVQPTLLWYHSEWLLHRGSHYDVVEPDMVRRDIYAFIEGAGGYPDQKAVSNVMDALKGLALAERGTHAPPCWLEEDDQARRYPANEILACQNGLLHLPSGTLLDPTPNFFTRNGVPYDYDPDAPEPKAWLAFLDSVWGHDPEQITLLQEVLGYVLVPDTSLQKFFVLTGVTRSGKGTILKTIGRLLGSSSLCSPRLEDLGSKFGLEVTLGKTVAVVADMRLPTSRNTDKQGLIGNMLRIVGEDPVDIERKFIGGAITAKLAIRILIATNLVPALPDVSGALTARLVALKMTESFLGREDLTLDRKLEGELAGILNWAIAGWKRLHQQGHFTVTAASREVQEEMATLASPLRAFLNESCVFNTEARASKEEVWRAFQRYMQRHDMPSTYTSPNFFHRDLEVAAQHRIKTVRPKVDGDRSRYWQGLRLLPGTTGPSQEEW